MEISSEDKMNTTNGLLKTAATEFEDIVDSWKGLVPSAVGCFASVAGKNSLKF